MTDRSALLQNLNNPTIVVGAIPTKGFLDIDVVREFQQNAENPSIAQQCFPGGAHEINHDIFASYLSFGRKDTHASDVADGEPNEMGIVSVAGLYWGQYCSQREMEDIWYWQGVATTEQRLTNPLDSNTNDPDHGYAMITAGTHSIINNGPRPFFAGNLVAWQMPRAPFHSKSTGGLFNDGSLINKTARYGMPSSTFQFEVVPFDYTDFSVQFAAAFAAMTIPYNQNGIADVPLSKALPNSSYQQPRNHSCIQDEALSYKFGLSAVALSVIETLVRKGVLTVMPKDDVAAQAAAITEQDAHSAARNLGKALGLFDTGKVELNPLLTECMADLFLTNINCGDEDRVKAQTRFAAVTGDKDLLTIATQSVESNDDAAYNRLRLHGLDMLVQGIASSWHSKTEKIIGRAMNCAAQSDTLDVVFGHHTL